MRLSLLWFLPFFCVMAALTVLVICCSIFRLSIRTIANLHPSTVRFLRLLLLIRMRMIVMMMYRWRRKKMIRFIIFVPIGNGARTNGFRG